MPAYFSTIGSRWFKVIREKFVRLTLDMMKRNLGRLLYNVKLSNFVKRLSEFDSHLKNMMLKKLDQFLFVVSPIHMDSFKHKTFDLGSILEKLVH